MRKMLDESPHAAEQGLQGRFDVGKSDGLHVVTASGSPVGNDTDRRIRNTEFPRQHRFGHAGHADHVGPISNLRALIYRPSVVVATCELAPILSFSTVTQRNEFIKNICAAASENSSMYCKNF